MEMVLSKQQIPHEKNSSWPSAVQQNESSTWKRSQSRIQNPFWRGVMDRETRHHRHSKCSLLVTPRSFAELHRILFWPVKRSSKGLSLSHWIVLWSNLCEMWTFDQDDDEATAWLRDDRSAQFRPSR
jgi:hypothetical protein